MSAHRALGLVRASRPWILALRSRMTLVAGLVMCLLLVTACGEVGRPFLGAPHAAMDNPLIRAFLATLAREVLADAGERAAPRGVSL